MIADVLVPGASDHNTGTMNLPVIRRLQFHGHLVPRGKRGTTAEFDAVSMNNNGLVVKSQPRLRPDGLGLWVGVSELSCAHRTLLGYHTRINRQLGIYLMVNFSLPASRIATTVKERACQRADSGHSSIGYATH